MLVPTGSKHIVRAMILHDFEQVLSFLHFLKQNEMVPIGSKYVVRAMILDDFEPFLPFRIFLNKIKLYQSVQNTLYGQ